MFSGAHMPKKRRKKSEPSEITADRGDTDAASVAPKRLEIAGVFLFMLALLLSFALFSFERGDAGEHNLVGPLGVHLANGVLGAIGVIGYAAVIGVGLAAGAVILGRVARPSIGVLFSWMLMIVAASVLAHLVSGSGGVVGAVLGEAGSAVAGGAGTALVCVGLMLAGVMVAFDVSVGQALRDAASFFGMMKTRAVASIETQREANRAAAEREAEVMEAERSRRAQARIDQEAREVALKESLEEKKRLAVVRATAKAEERAMAKIAKERVKAAQEEQDEEEEEDDEEVEEPLEGEDDIEAVIQSLRIPGPASEPEVIIAANAADVLEELAGSGVEEDERETDPGEAEAAEDDGEEEEEEDEVEKKIEDDDDGIRVYERKHTETIIDDASATVEAKPAVKEKRVYQMPPINLLDYEGKPPAPVDGEALRAKATRLEEKLKTYGVEGRVTAIRPGPVVTTYEYQPAPGVKVAKIANLSDDIAMSMEAMRVRIVAPIPGRGVVGIELPNEVRESVYLKEIIAHDSFKKSKSMLTLALGKDAEGEPQVRDLKSMPHILVAGTTGSGKSVSINTMILSVLYKATPEQVKFIMVDPKMLELSLYADIPHLLLPVVTDPRKASLALQWAVDEMERRYQMLADFKVRDIDGFNKRLERLRLQRELGEPVPETSEIPADASATPAAPAAPAEKKIHDPWPAKEIPDPLPYIVVLIDEFADLMCVAPRDVEASVQRLAQKARAAGIHVMLATQRPSTDVITGVIKNNFPSRISFRVASRHDSATILNAPGAENLLGMGDSLVLGVSTPNPVRVHGAFVSEEEVQRVVDFWKAQAKPTYDATILQRRESEDGDGDGEPMEHDEMYDRAVAIVTETRKASISAIQRRLRVGYNRAARMIEMMETEGIVGPASGPKGEREVLVRAMSNESSAED
jgi:S-DNA-T family DNA segregation ATPase FtsK/SpoIIIE